MSVLAKELNERLQTGPNTKLYQIDKTTLLFKIRALNKDQSLSHHCWVNPCNVSQETSSRFTKGT